MDRRITMAEANEACNAAEVASDAAYHRHIDEGTAASEAAYRDAFAAYEAAYEAAEALYSDTVDGYRRRALAGIRRLGAALDVADAAERAADAADAS